MGNIGRILYTIQQSIFAGLIMVAILLCFEKFSDHRIFNAIGMTSIASSIAIIFMSPHTIVGTPKAILGGYCLAILVGVCCHYGQSLLGTYALFLPRTYSVTLYGSLAVVICVLLMAFSDLFHPPAVGLALGIVTDVWEPPILIIIGLIILCLTLIKYFLDFKPLMR